MPQADFLKDTPVSAPGGFVVLAAVRWPGDASGPDGGLLMEP